MDAKAKQALLTKLRERFEENMHRHEGIEWADVQARLEANEAKLRSLRAMEQTGGEPDVIGRDEQTGEYIFCDCSAALESRTANRPETSAMDMAREMGIELLTEDEYFALQKLGPFDTKTSSWLKTPLEVRRLGGALFGDYRFGRVFIYHNGAQSYYASRGFRGILRV